MKLYHFTSETHLKEIIKSGYIKLSPSNLERPINERVDKENMRTVADNDDVRPVVWLTSTPVIKGDETGVYNIDDAKRKAIDQALADGKITKEQYEILIESKTSVRIAVEKTQDMFRWTRWAEENGIESKWFKALKQAAADYGNFYVCEREIPVGEFVQVEINGKQADITDFSKI
ncbi:MAG: hypothetical protein K6E77_05565 [Lachnospiraceae bacterium]|nr:hypothetical protein [Lachnospiraceae bacterium]